MLVKRPSPAGANAVQSRTALFRKVVRSALANVGAEACPCRELLLTEHPPAVHWKGSWHGGFAGER